MTTIVNELKQALSQAPETYDEDALEEIYNKLIVLDHTTKFDSKHYKKLYRLCLWILKFKGDQMVEMQEQMRGLTHKQIDEEQNEVLIPEELNEEINRLKATIDKLELDKAHYKNKTREQTQEISLLQRKLQEGVPDEDSGDALSELDKQQELLNNINTKNKHIKRLLRDIEELETQNVTHLRQITDLQSAQKDSDINLATMAQQFHESQVIINKQTDTIKEHILEIESLKHRLIKASQEKQEIHKEVEVFKKQLEERALIWKRILETKDKELQEVKQQYDDLLSKHPGYNIDQERNELQRLTETLSDKDKAQQDLENVVQRLNLEIETLNEHVTALNREKTKLEIEKMESKSGKCCIETKQLLEKSNERCKELQEMLSTIENDNSVKAKQAFEAIEALKAYEKGQYGLPDALMKINKLQDKLNMRENKIKELITEVNQANELAMENCILRKRLGIPIEEVISTKSFIAKQKRFEKTNEKLTLKLRAYEEMLLQMKLERNDLRRQLAGDTDRKPKRKRKTDANGNDSRENIIDEEDLSSSEIHTLPGDPEVCENCLKQFNAKKPVNKIPLCTECRPENKAKIEIKRLMKNYDKVIEENENLRIGMHEILQRLREYNATSSHITIDSSTLERLLHALDARSISGWYMPAMRMQNELMVTKERELALLERVRLSEEILKSQQSTSLSDGLKRPSTAPESPSKAMLQEHVARLERELQEKMEKLDKLEKIMESDDQDQTELLAENDRLRIVEKQYSDVMSTLEQSDNEKDQIIVSTLKNVHEIETQMGFMQRKFDYLKQENINLVNSLKKVRLDHNDLLHELKIQLLQKSEEIEKLKNLVKDTSQEERAIDELENEVRKLKLDMSSSCTKIFKNMTKIKDSVDNVELDLSKMETVAVVKENLAVEYVTIDEFKTLKNDKNSREREIHDVKAKMKHLEDIVSILNEQLASQQKLISRQSDEEISLRHLVADLQSSSEDNYLLVRTKKELDNAYAVEAELRTEIDRFQNSIRELNQKLTEKETDKSLLEKQYSELRKNDSLKIKFLKKTLMNLRDSYMLYTPLYGIVDFLKIYSRLQEQQESLEEKMKCVENENQEKQLKFLEQNLKQWSDSSEIQIRIEALKLQSQCDYLSKELTQTESKVKQLQKEIHSLASENIQSSEHWNTLTMLFDDSYQKKRTGIHKETQTEVKTSHKSVSTDQTTGEKQDLQERSNSAKTSPKRMHYTRQLDVESVAHALSSHESLKTQLKQALSLASARSALLLETETRLAESHGRIRTLEKSIEDKDSQLNEIKESKSGKTTIERKEDNILTITIASLQNLLLEKDTTLSRYRELLEAERHEHSKAHEDQLNEVKKLKKNVEEHEREISNKTDEIKTLKEKMEASSRKQLKDISSHSDTDESVKGSTEKFVTETTKEQRDHLMKVRILEEEVTKLHTQLQEVSDREKIWERSLNEKENEIHKLREKLQTTQPDGIEITENIINRREIEQLSAMLDEKDRHIQDLTDTLTHFHDDQQKFINDTDIHSTEQVTQLSVDLNRCEASNRILKTQLDAMKRQLSNVTQRENQARDLVKNLKAQLIRRPVISVKSESLMSVREEQLRKKNQQLEIELGDVKEELRHQTALNENRRAKSASDLGLWEKQKRWQQTAEKLKERLNEREAELDKLRATLTTAKTSIARLEREKHILEQRTSSHYCTSASCPNLHQASKFTPADSPESYGTSSVTPERERDHGGVAAVNVLNDTSRELVEALKNRVEAQQRRIVALELEGKGSNAVATEIEKLQELNSDLQGQNLKLEARMLQVQLDNDKLKQSHNPELMSKQIKHLEDYISTMKGELIRTKTALDTAKETIQLERTKNEQLEKTVATLRAMIDKIKSETRPKSGKSLSAPSTSKTPPDEKSEKRLTVSQDMYENLQSEFNKMQKAYSELTDKLSSMQIELQLQTGLCTHCGTRRDSSSSSSDAVEGDLESELKQIRNKLSEKSRLLEKAKILLTRAAAKEKNLREQIAYLRRRCSELQNVPVIEETSE